MTNNNYAVVNEACPVCRQGRLFVAITDSTSKDFFILCEDCESEWDLPEGDSDMEMAMRDKHKFSRCATIADVAGHPWGKFVLNK